MRVAVPFPCAFTIRRWETCNKSTFTLNSQDMQLYFGNWVPVYATFVTFEVH